LPRLRLKRVAEEQLKALAPHVRDEVDLALLQIQADPEHEGLELLGALAGRWRKRVGGYRIIYRILEGGRLVVVDAIRPRGAETYSRRRR
jgi:mRNA-degrading endonuclease RelE of RelBE toxin-antitoxin system